jgi:hypothetical protein
MIRLDTLTFARIAADTYEPASSTALTGDWSIQDFNATDNFLVRAYKPSRGKFVVIAIRGSDNWKDWVVADAGAIGLSLNAMALHLNSAIDFTMKMKGLYGDCWLVGHSLGGAYVQLLAPICELPGVTFNAPGVLNLLNQMSSRIGTRMVGSIGGGAMSLLTHGLTDYFNKAVASVDDHAFPAVANFGANLDPVSRIGSHVGAPIQRVTLRGVPLNPHGMRPLLEALGYAAKR